MKEKNKQETESKLCLGCFKKFPRNMFRLVENEGIMCENCSKEFIKDERR